MNTNSVDFFKNQPLTSVSPETSLIIAAWKISNPNNMGHIIRMGHNVGAENILFIGDEHQKRESKIKKTAGFSFDQQKWGVVSETEFFSFLESKYTLVALETCEEARNIYDVELPSKMVLLAGNESYGLSNDMINKSTLQVYIPMPGDCKSMNISHALSVAVFEWYRQMAFKGCSHL